MANREPADNKESPLVGELVDQFLRSVKLQLSARTYDWYAVFLQSFRTFAGEKQAASLTNSVVYAWIEKCYGNKSASARRAAARTVVRMLNWAVEERLLDEKPLRHFRKPAETRRETSLTPAQYALCLRTAVQGADKDIIKFLWHTGCRPQELRAIEARFIEGNKITLPVALSKGKRERRVIYLNGMAQRITSRLAEQQPEGPIFRNINGEPWTTRTLSHRFQKLRDKTNIPGLCAYAFRHAFITRMLEKGIDAATVAAIAGNSADMVLNNYNHIAQNQDRLAELVA